MLWVETGAGDHQWTSAPMQCGVNHDLGLGDLLDKPQGHLILPPQYQKSSDARERTRKRQPKYRRRYGISAHAIGEFRFGCRKALAVRTFPPATAHAAGRAFSQSRTQP